MRRERAGQRRAQEARRSESSHLEILLGVVLDGVEESLGGPHVHCGAFLLGPGRSLLRGLRIPNASLLLRGLKPCLARLRRGHCHVPFTLSLSHSQRASSLSLAHPKTPPWAPPKPLEGQNTTGHIFPNGNIADFDRQRCTSIVTLIGRWRETSVVGSAASAARRGWVLGGQGAERHGKRGKRRARPPRGRVSNDNNNLRSLGTRNE